MSLAGFRHVTGAPFRALFDVEGRRAWAVMLMAGCGIAMTAFASAALYIVRGNPNFAFYLGLAALMLIGIIVTGFAGLIVKRDIDINALGAKFHVTDQDVQNIAAAVVTATPASPPVVIQTGKAD